MKKCFLQNMLKMFLARRKLLALLSALTVFVVFMTINHYFYLDAADNEAAADAPSSAHAHHGKNDLEVQREIQLEMNRKRSQFRNGGDDEDEDDDGMKKVAFIPKGKRRLKSDPDAPEGTTRSPYDDDDIQALSSDGLHYIPKRRVVHIDMKGAPPKLNYLKALFPLLREAGATTLLLEYEDMFPFWGDIKNISATNAYTKEQIARILKYAAKSHLEVIPLVQTFGHLEMALKLEEFKALREVPYHPQAVCPSQDGSWKLITQIIDQVLELHPNTDWLHIGCDEVYHLGQCPLCIEKISVANNDPNSNIYHDGKTLFLQHVHRLGSYVKEQKKVVPIIWDDMLRTIPSQTLMESGLGKLVEPMVWVYIEDIDRFIDPVTWSSFAETFPHMWTASAFKGAFGERLYLANIQRHVGNNLAWAEVMRRETQGPNAINFRGIVLTGWSRYDHFAVLCELLPTSVPSLVLNLVLLKDGMLDRTAAKRANRLLQCSSGKMLMTQEELMHNPVQWDLHRCKYPGSQLFSLLSSYDMNRKEIESLYEKLTKSDGWMTDYNVRHRFSSTQRVMEMMKSAGYLRSSLKSMETQFRDILSNYFDKYTTDEWVEQHIFPLTELLRELTHRATVLTADTVWPRRPLPKVQLPEEVKST